MYACPDSLIKRETNGVDSGCDPPRHQWPSRFGGTFPKKVFSREKIEFFKKQIDKNVKKIGKF
jgi:hypothetical protein